MNDPKPLTPHIVTLRAIVYTDGEAPTFDTQVIRSLLRTGLKRTDGLSEVAVTCEPVGEERK